MTDVPKSNICFMFDIVIWVLKSCFISYLRFERHWRSFCYYGNGVGEEEGGFGAGGRERGFLRGFRGYWGIG